MIVVLIGMYEVQRGSLVAHLNEPEHHISYEVILELEKGLVV